MAAPLAAAIVIVAAVCSPFGEAERTASLSLPALRLGRLALLLTWGAFLLALAGLAPAEESAAMLLRNGAGFLGLALLGARLVGVGVSWLLPLACGAAAVVGYLGGTDPGAWWLWPTQSTADGSAYVIAVSFLVVGLGTVVIAGARDVPGDAA